MKKLAELVRRSQNILLTTHRQCDGDGLGAELAVFHALKKMGKNVFVVNVDRTPKKYHFLNPESHILSFEEHPEWSHTMDLALIMDTNDERLVEPLYTRLKQICRKIAFVDHHPVLTKGPHPSVESVIDITAASTGEMAYKLIKELGVDMDKNIARCLYTSITFDTQLYRYIRNSPNSHRIAAELLDHKIDTENIHRSLFGNQTVQKMAFLARALGQIEYFCEGRMAVLRLRDADLFHYNLEPDESRDVIDMIMNIETLEVAALFREEAIDQYKVSLRSKGQIEVLSMAEVLGGGGHMFAAGALVKSPYLSLKDKVVRELSESLDKVDGSKRRMTGS